jgi:hypothetical protein
MTVYFFSNCFFMNLTNRILSTSSGLIFVRRWFKTRPAVENSLSTFADVAGMDKSDRAYCERSGNR